MVYSNIRKKYVNLPFQAISARLANIQPVEPVIQYCMSLIYFIKFFLLLSVFKTLCLCWSDTD